MRSQLEANTTSRTKEVGTSVTATTKMNAMLTKISQTVRIVKANKNPAAFCVVALMCCCALTVTAMRKPGRDSDLSRTIAALTSNKSEVVFSRIGTIITVYDGAVPEDVVAAIKAIPTEVVSVRFTPTYRRTEGDPPLDSSEWNEQIARERIAFYKEELREYKLRFDANSF